MPVPLITHENNKGLAAARNTGIAASMPEKKEPNPCAWLSVSCITEKAT